MTNDPPFTVTRNIIRHVFDCADADCDPALFPNAYGIVRVFAQQMAQAVINVINNRGGCEAQLSSGLPCQKGQESPCLSCVMGWAITDAMEVSPLKYELASRPIEDPVAVKVIADIEHDKVALARKLKAALALVNGKCTYGFSVARSPIPGKECIRGDAQGACTYCYIRWAIEDA